MQQNRSMIPQGVFATATPAAEQTIKYLQLQLLHQNERTLMHDQTEKNNKMNITVFETSPNKFMYYSNGSAASHQGLFSKRQPQVHDVKCKVHCSKGKLWIDMDEEAMFLLYQQYHNTK